MQDEKKDKKPEILFGEIERTNSGRYCVTVYTPVHLNDKYGYTESYVGLDDVQDHVTEYEKTGVQSTDKDNDYIHLPHHLSERKVSTCLKKQLASASI